MPRYLAHLRMALYQHGKFPAYSRKELPKLTSGYRRFPVFFSTAKAALKYTFQLQKTNIQNADELSLFHLPKAASLDLKICVFGKSQCAATAC
jgi:hypothetical protein